MKTSRHDTIKYFIPGIILVWNLCRLTFWVTDINGLKLYNFHEYFLVFGKIYTIPLYVHENCNEWNTLYNRTHERKPKMMRVQKIETKNMVSSICQTLPYSIHWSMCVYFIHSFKILTKYWQLCNAYLTHTVHSAFYDVRKSRDSQQNILISIRAHCTFNVWCVCHHTQYSIKME